MGPIQILLLGFEDIRATGGIADELTSLSDAGTIRAIDARLLLKDSADEVVAVRVSDLDDSGREDLRAAAGALVGLGAGGGWCGGCAAKRRRGVVDGGVDDRTGPPCGYHATRGQWSTTEGRPPDSAWTVGTTVQPTPRRTISRSTSG